MNESKYPRKTPFLVMVKSTKTEHAREIYIQTHVNRIGIAVITDEFWQQCKEDKQTWEYLKDHLRTAWTATEACYPAFMEVKT